MKILIVLSVLVFCASAKVPSLHLVDPTDATTCNVSDARIVGYYIWHDPERRMRAEGSDYFEDSTKRRANVGTAYIYTGSDTHTTFKFQTFHFFNSYTMIVNGNQTIHIPARTTYRWEQSSDGEARCDKFEMNTADVYLKPGVPSIFTCRRSVFEGWKNPDHNDGLLLKLCDYAWTTETRYIFISVTDIMCYPVKLSDVKRDRLHRIQIVEEMKFYGWNPNFGDFPLIPAECWNV